MKNYIKQHPRISTVICLLSLIVVACTLHVKTNDPVVTVKVVIQLPDGGLINYPSTISDAGVVDSGM